jgi:hypothetical protein
MLYNRVRIILLDSTLQKRDSDGTRAKYDIVLAPLGGRYCGWMVHPYMGPNPAHFYIIDDPTDDVMAKLLIYASKTPGYPFKLFREYKGADTVEFSFNSIMADVAAVLQTEFVETESPDSDANKLARCWSGVRVLAQVASR